MESRPVRKEAARVGRPVKGRIRRWIKHLILLVVLGGLLLVWLAPAWVLPPLARWLDVSEALRPVHYVLVLNGDPETRPFAAAALVRAGLAREVLLTRQLLAMESSTVQRGTMLSELEITKKVLLIRGVPDNAIRVLPGEITSTVDEARELASFLETRPHTTVAVVTNNFHTRRARMIFAKMLGESASRVSFIGVPRDGAEEDSWWRTSHGCTVHLSEYCKLPYYWVRY